MAKKPSNQGKPWTSKDVSELRELEEGPMLIRQQLHAAREKAAAQQHHLAPRAESEGALS